MTDENNPRDSPDPEEIMTKYRGVLAQLRPVLSDFAVEVQIELRDAIRRCEAALDPAGGVIQGHELTRAMGALVQIVKDLGTQAQAIRARRPEFEIEEPPPDPEKEAALDEILKQVEGTQGTPEVRAAVKTQLSLLAESDRLLEQLRAILPNCPEQDAGELRAAIAKVEQAMNPEAIGSGDKRKDFREAMSDLLLVVQTIQAAARGRGISHTARLAEYWSRAPQEKWDFLDPKGRRELEEWVAKWRTRRREEVLGQLPIEERLRLEAGLDNLED